MPTFINHGKRLLLRMLFAGLLFSISFQATAQDIGSSGEAIPALRTSGSAQSAVAGLIPSDVRRAYGFDQVSNQGAGQTIGIIEAFDHPAIEDDLAIFSQMFNLPACTTSNGCFQKVFASENGASTNPVWALETALDVEWAHAMAPQARILLVEAPSDRLSDLLSAVDVAVQNGAGVISMSWGLPEFSGETLRRNHFVAPNVSFVAAAGDYGNPGFWPAASPDVTAVGGTKLHLNSHGDYITETALKDGGGGLSEFEVEPLYQSQLNIPENPGGKRGIPDVAYNADPNVGFAVYDSILYLSSGWIEVGGTSAGAPQWAALIAIANSMRMAADKYPLSGSNESLYRAANSSSYDSNYNDITGGTNTNGHCGPLCSSTRGYDYVTGLGSPQANNLINALVNAP